MYKNIFQIFFFIVFITNLQLVASECQESVRIKNKNKLITCLDANRLYYLLQNSAFVENFAAKEINPLKISEDVEESYIASQPYYRTMADSDRGYREKESFKIMLSENPTILDQYTDRV